MELSSCSCPRAAADLEEEEGGGGSGDCGPSAGSQEGAKQVFKPGERLGVPKLRPALGVDARDHAPSPCAAAPACSFLLLSAAGMCVEGILPPFPALPPHRQNLSQTCLYSCSPLENIDIAATNELP